MIKKIHYCWFGSAMPDNVKRNVDAWSTMNPDFELVEWNEGNIDVSGYEFGRRALEAKRWGFLVDTIRPKALYEEGGFYLDADIELTSPLNKLEPDGDKLVMGYMNNAALGTAALYAPPGHPYLIDILDLYNRIRDDFWPVSNSIFTEYFINHVDGFLLNGQKWSNDKASIYPKEFLEQPAFVKHRGIAIHHYSGSWSPQKGNSFSLDIKQNGNWNHYLLWLKRKIRTFLSLRNSEFRHVYKQARKGMRVPFPEAKRYYRD